MRTVFPTQRTRRNIRTMIRQMLATISLLLLLTLMLPMVGGFHPQHTTAQADTLPLGATPVSGAWTTGGFSGGRPFPIQIPAKHVFVLTDLTVVPNVQNFEIRLYETDPGNPRYVLREQDGLNAKVTFQTGLVFSNVPSISFNSTLSNAWVSFSGYFQYQY